MVFCLFVFVCIPHLLTQLSLSLSLPFWANQSNQSIKSINHNKCCDDPSQTFSELFDFAIQTSTTIGYGGYVPIGPFSNFLVFMLSFLTLIVNSVYAGLLFLQFVTPYSKLHFSDIITYSNLNGFPCLEFRVANADCINTRTINPLVDVEARLSFNYHINYIDDISGEQSHFGNTSYLRLLTDRRQNLNEGVWTLRHVVDESSPLFGIRFDEKPGTQIIWLRLYISAIQDISGQRIIQQTAYSIEDIMVGYRFVDQMKYDNVTKQLDCDYGKMNDIIPSPVWYPTKNPLT